MGVKMLDTDQDGSSVSTKWGDNMGVAPFCANGAHPS